MSQYFLDCAIDRHYPIALCLDPTKTDEEVLLALIESLSNDLARMAYKVNLFKASRGKDITPDMLSSFGLLPSIQYSSVEAIDNRQVDRQLFDDVISGEDYTAPKQLAEVIVDGFNSPNPLVVTKDEEDEDENNDDDPYEGMTDEEYLAATAHLIHNIPVV